MSGTRRRVSRTASEFWLSLARPGQTAATVPAVAAAGSRSAGMVPAPVAAGTRSSTSRSDGAGLTGRRLTIGEAARRSGFSIRTLRFYERSGLLSPASRTPSGYRLYTDADLGRLEFIRGAKALGLSLREIGDLIVAAQSRTCRATRPLLLELLDSRIRQTAAHMRALRRLKRTLERQRRVLLELPPTDHRLGYCSCLASAAALTRPRERASAPARTAPRDRDRAGPLPPSRRSSAR